MRAQIRENPAATDILAKHGVAAQRPRAPVAFGDHRAHRTAECLASHDAPNRAGRAIEVPYQPGGEDPARPLGQGHHVCRGAHIGGQWFLAQDVYPPLQQRDRLSGVRGGR